MPSHDDERGLARERTGLAWERCALAYAALGGVVLGVAAHRDAPGLLPVSAALAVVAAATWRHGRRAYEHPAVAPQARALRLLTLTTALTAVAAAIAVVVRL
jgi:hypothetical protein